MGTAVAKQPQQSIGAPKESASAKPTTWKVNGPVAVVLRKIQAHTGGNQESVMDLFAEDFDNYLATLQARDEAERKRRTSGG